MNTYNKERKKTSLSMPKTAGWQNGNLFSIE